MSFALAAPSATGRTARWRELALLLVTLLACAQAFRVFRDYVFEDAFITYRYADNLAAGNGFVFNPGERVFGTTTPLYTLVLAALARLGAPIPDAGALLSSLCVGGTALAGAWLLRRAGRTELALVYALAVLWGAGGTYFLTGMETSFFCLLLHGALIAAWLRRPWATGVLLGLACLTRYDAVVFAAPLLALMWRREGRLPWRSALACGALLACWLVFAWRYFGSPLPNTLSAKAGRHTIAEYLASAGSLLARDLFAPLLALYNQPLSRAVPVAVLALLLAPIPWRLAAQWRREPLLLQAVLYPALLLGGYACIGPGASGWHLLPAGLFLLLAALGAWGELAEARLARARAWPATALLLASAVLLPPGIALYGANARALPSYAPRADAYAELAGWMTRHGLTDLRVFIDEPGYFSFCSKCRVVDGYGLVTLGVPIGAALAERVDERTVEALAGVGHLDGYVPVQLCPRSLELRRDVFAARLDTLAAEWLAPARDAAPAAPLPFDFARHTRAGWSGPLRFIGARGAEHYLTTDEAVTFERTANIVSPPFPLACDELRLSFEIQPAGAKLKNLALELVVGGLPVLTVDEHDLAPGERREVRLPVHAWRGRTARLRLSDVSPRGWLEVHDVRALRHRAELAFDDFEAATYGERWSSTFGPAPASWRAVVEALGLAAVQGQRTALSLGRSGAQALVSRPFRVEHEFLAGVVLDCGGPSTRVELRVDGAVVRTLAGRNSRALRGLLFDLAEFRGREAVLAVIDDDPRAELGIGVDALVLCDP